jgi:hypothetical protein
VSKHQAAAMDSTRPSLTATFFEVSRSYNIRSVVRYFWLPCLWQRANTNSLLAQIVIFCAMDTNNRIDSKPALDPHQDHLDRLRHSGYNEQEARFLYLAATHSGYFTRHQFLGFTHQTKGCLVHRFTTKLLDSASCPSNPVRS